ncbi:hypothetical protein [Nocardiopsis sp. CNT312]|nr:hypothetical protein [Nocardiopsis sp. CNT312]
MAPPVWPRLFPLQVWDLPGPSSAHAEAVRHVLPRAPAPPPMA